LLFNLKPARPLTAYNFFTKELYQKGDVKGFGKSKQIAEKWDKLSEDDKEKFHRMAKKEHLIYIIKKRNYDAFIRKDIGKAPTAINLFYADNAGKDLNLKDLYSKWKGADASTKKKYQKKAQEAKDEFQKKVEDIKLRVYDKPKRGLTAYNFFFKQEYRKLRDKNTDVTTAELFKKLSKAYADLSEKQMKVFEDLADNEFQEKKEQMRQYEKDGYYLLKELKKRKSRAKKESNEEGGRASSKKKQAKSPTKSTKKPKKV